MRRGVPPEESAARSVATAGSAVVFAAVTVIIALLGLSVAQIPFLTTMGVAAALAVAIAVLISMTLTPALLGFAGMRIVAKRFRPAPEGTAAERPDGPAAAEKAAADDEAPEPPRSRPPAHVIHERGFFLGWVRAVTRWPVVTVVLVAAVLGVATLPAASLRLALPDAGSLDAHEPARITYDLITHHFGPGYNGPLVVTGSIIQSTDPVGLMNDIAKELRSVPGVAAVPLSTPNPPGDTGIAQVIPVGAPDSPSTEQLVATLRGMHEHFLKEFGADLSVTGYTAAGIDISARLAGALIPFGILVVGLSLILLAMVFRSIVVPVTAALGYVLSIGAALGLTSLVFESGYLAGPLHVMSVGSVVSFMPIILMGVLFGLAMDYEVFLVSRMREDYVHGAPARSAVRSGFVGSARVVTAAAIIMFAVFAAFIPEGDASIQPIAFGLAVGVAIDAFLVRMTLIPAVLMLFGRVAWWFPRRLDRALPRFDVEGEGLREELESADWPAAGAAIAIAAEDVVVGTAERPVVRFGTMVPAGDVLVVRGAAGTGKSAALMVIAGRTPVASGRLKVAGFILRARTGAVRAHVGVARPAAGEDPVEAVRAAVAGHPPVVVIDDADRVTDPAARLQVAQLIREERSAAVNRGRHLTVVLAAAPGADIDDLVPPAAHRTTLTLLAGASEEEELETI